MANFESGLGGTRAGNKNLQYLLVPTRLVNALKSMDTDGDGEIDRMEWTAAIETALKAKLAARAEERDARAAAARKELEEFTAEFLNARAGVVYCPRLAPAAGQSRIAAGFAPFSHSFVSRRRASASSSLTKTTRGP